MATQKRLYIDMDGTLAVFTPAQSLETLYERGYFYNLAPIENVLEAVKNIISDNPGIEVNILSAVLTDSEFAIDEKNAWLDKYLPEIPNEHRIFPPCGADKKLYIPNLLSETDFLLDDYTVNLTAWEPPARGIKLLNGINNSRGTWHGDAVSFNKTADEIAKSITDIVQGNLQVRDNDNLSEGEKVMTNYAYNGYKYRGDKDFSQTADFRKAHPFQVFGRRATANGLDCCKSTIEEALAACDKLDKFIADGVYNSNGIYYNDGEFQQVIMLADMNDGVFAVVKDGSAMRVPAVMDAFEKIDGFLKTQERPHGEDIKQSIASDDVNILKEDTEMTNQNQMEISARTTPYQKEGTNLRGFATITLNGNVAVKNIKIAEGKDGLYIQMPTCKNGEKYEDIVFPTTADFRAKLNEAILKEFENPTAKDAAEKPQPQPLDIKVSVTPVDNSSAVRGVAKVTLNDCLVISNVKVIDSAKGAFVQMPNYKNGKGDYVDIALPITADFREKLTEAVINKFNQREAIIGNTDYKDLGKKEDLHYERLDNKSAATVTQKLIDENIPFSGIVSDKTTLTVNKSDLDSFSKIVAQTKAENAFSDHAQNTKSMSDWKKGIENKKSEHAEQTDNTASNHESQEKVSSEKER